MIRSGIPPLLKNASIMHGAILVDHKQEKNVPVLQLAEAQARGVGKNWLKLNQLSSMRKAEMVWFFVPKSPIFRAILKDLANTTSSNMDEKISYNFKSLLTCVFHNSAEYDAQAYAKIACVITDILQGRQIRNICDDVESEICTSYVTLLLQASYVLEKIPMWQLPLIKQMPRDNSIIMIFNKYIRKSIPDHLACDSQFVVPGELYGRLLFFSQDKKTPWQS